MSCVRGAGGGGVPVINLSVLHCLLSVNDDNSFRVSVAAARPYVSNQTGSANNVQYD